MQEEPYAITRIEWWYMNPEFFSRKGNLPAELHKDVKWNLHSGEWRRMIWPGPGEVTHLLHGLTILGIRGLEVAMLYPEDPKIHQGPTVTFRYSVPLLFQLGQQGKPKKWDYWVMEGVQAHDDPRITTMTRDGWAVVPCPSPQWVSYQYSFTETTTRLSTKLERVWVKDRNILLAQAGHGHSEYQWKTESVPETRLYNKTDWVRVPEIPESMVILKRQRKLS